MAYSLPSVPFWQPALNSLGEFVTGLDELEQSLRIIVTTPKGSVPRRPEFGCDLLSLVDNPQPGVLARMVRLITEAIEDADSRIKVSGVKVSNETFGGCTYRVCWYPRGTISAAPVETEVFIPGSVVVEATPAAVPSYVIGGAVVDGGML